MTRLVTTVTKRGPSLAVMNYITPSHVTYENKFHLEIIIFNAEDLTTENGYSIARALTLIIHNWRKFFYYFIASVKVLQRYGRGRTVILHSKF